MRGLLGVAMFAALVAGTILVFSAIDRGSHSASDTLRPFVITMVPVWVVAAWTARARARREGGAPFRAARRRSSCTRPR